MFIRAIKAFGITLALAALPLHADGFRFKNGRIDGEPVIVLQLNAHQARAVHQAFKPGYVLHLTKSQRAFILANTKAKVSPTKLEIYKPSNLEHDCSCGFWNLGLLFAPQQIELPVGRICSDQEAKDNQIGD